MIVSGATSVRRTDVVASPRCTDYGLQDRKGVAHMASKVWFITGASRGFGREWALGALRRGDRVAVAARDVAPLQRMRDDFGDAVLPLQLDVTDRAADIDAVAATHDYFGRLDVVVNNAGYGQCGFVEELSEKELRAQMETNFFGAVWVTQAALPYLRQQRSGHILQVTSTGGLVSAPEVASYCASKFALEGLSEAMAEEVRPFGIHVTLVEPGRYATGFDAATTRADAMPAYAHVHEQAAEALAQILGPASDPASTVGPLLAAVDAEAPPLRLLLGPGMLDLVTSVYGGRFEEWKTWYESDSMGQSQATAI
jgi:NAD(P)-dependent dehydrogenase (short-subunit alcohol dehydrogenase family)